MLTIELPNNAEDATAYISKLVIANKLPLHSAQWILTRYKEYGGHKYRFDGLWASEIGGRNE